MKDDVFPSLDPEKIRSRLPARRLIGNEIRVLSETDSTNDEIHRAAASGAGAGLVIFAESQRRGRGRRGHHWESPSGVDLLFSVLLRPPGAMADWTWLTHAAAVAICRTIEARIDVPTALKWPNDVLLGSDQRKAAGILLEARGGASPYAVLGIGLNVNAEGFGGDLRNRATSMRLAAGGGEPLERELIAADLLRELDGRCGLGVEDGEGEAVRERVIEEAARRSAFWGGKVSVRQGDRRLYGVFEGLGSRGELLLKGEEGQQWAIETGEAVIWEA